jgi:hypothetical protein
MILTKNIQSRIFLTHKAKREMVQSSSSSSSSFFPFLIGWPEREREREREREEGVSSSSVLDQERYKRILSYCNPFLSRANERIREEGELIVGFGFGKKRECPDLFQSRLSERKRGRSWELFLLSVDYFL